MPGCLFLGYPGNLVTRKLSDVAGSQAPPHMKFYMEKNQKPSLVYQVFLVFASSAYFRLIVATLYLIAYFNTSIQYYYTMPSNLLLVLVRAGGPSITAVNERGPWEKRQPLGSGVSSGGGAVAVQRRVVQDGGFVRVR